MAADNKLELVVEIDTNRANASIKSVNSSLSSMEAAAAKSARGASAGIDGLTASMVKGAAAGTVLDHAFERALGWLKEYGAEIVKYAARTQTLGVVTNQLAKVNDYNAASVNRLVDRIKQLGVSTQEAHGVVQRMIFAELDLSKATDLARVAQGTTYLDKNGIEQVAPLTQAAWQSVLEIMRNKLAAWKEELHKNTVEYFRDYVKEMEEADNRRRELEGKQFQERLANVARIAEANLAHIETVYSFEERRAGFVRDAQLRALDAGDAQTLEQKVAVEQRKAAIEIEHITRVHEIRMRLFDLETLRMVLEEEATLKRLGYRVDEIQARIAELTAQRDEIKRFRQEATDTAVQGARESATIRQAQIVRDQNQRIFDSFKRQAEGVFDALLTRSQSVWSAIGNSLKTALLTAIKDVVTSRVAAMLMQLFTGQRVGFAQASAGGGGVLGGLGGMLGVGAVPVFGGTSLPGATPPFVPSGSTAGTGGMLSKAGWGATLANLKSFAGIGGSVQLAPGVATTWEAATMGQKLSAIGKSNAALMGGAMLAMYGLQRGGISGLAMTTAGGAMIGYKFGGPIGAAIGAGIGAVAGLVRLFVRGAQDKAREKIKATYGVDIRDKGVLKQIVDIAKQGFGGNLDMAIRSPQIRDLVELYALSTGQGTSGPPATMRPVSLLQQGGSLFQTSASGLTLDRIGSGTLSSAAPTVINITVCQGRSKTRPPRRRKSRPL